MPHIPSLLQRATLALLCCGPAWAAEPIPAITLTPAQAEAAGVRTLALAPSASSAGAGLVLPGQVELPPQATELVSSPLAGVVQQVLVAPGDKVKAGQPLARVSSPELLAWQREWLQAQSQARLAASKLARDEQLHAEGIIAGQRLQDSRAAHEQAQITLQERRQALQALGLTAGGTLQPQLLLRASSSGTVLDVAVLPGQRLEAGMAVAKVARSGPLALVLQAQPAQVARLALGARLRVAGCQAPAELTAIVPQVNPGNQTVQVRARWQAAEDCLRVGQFVEATLTDQPTAADTSALQVPAQAVVYQQGKAYVFVRSAQGFVPTAVRLGPASTQGYRVLSGLQAGDAVAIAGLAALKGAWLGLGNEGSGGTP
ncbi:MAG: efflux RND transporter periplasmic adaptor subunit [Comamonadaceae bacterium]|nr:efflux RND transporter periplasmic adaptor subunit [Comamonadaceae bacterium]